MTLAAHACEPPADVMPGDDWSCEQCGQRWWADEVGYDLDAERSTIVWRKNEASL